MKLMVRPKNAVEELTEYKEAKEAMDTYDEELESGWELIDSKLVEDTDGFLTDYTLWYNIISDEWVTIFGDNDMYDPSNTIADMEFGSSEDEARDWFAEYQTDDDEDDDWY